MANDWGQYEENMEEWREEKAADPDWREQKKANYIPPKLKYERALAFIERERSNVYELLKRRAINCIRDHEFFDVDYEIKNLKRYLQKSLGYTSKEVKEMFKGCYGPIVNRELILEVPELANWTRIRKGDVSEFYKGTLIEEIEKSHARDMENGGDFAA